MSPAGERPFALVPRRRFVGVRFGQHRSPRRGQGDEVAGTRPYRPGDRPTWIDWPASARLSAARGTDEFVVREFYADTAPLVALAVDRRPRMSLYGPPLPWLDKPAAIAAVTAAIGRATAAAGGELAYVDERGGRPHWLSAGPPLATVGHVAAYAVEHPEAARPSSLDACLLALIRRASSFPAGTFVFVVSDFVDAVSPGILLQLRALRWDVTPVVIQDPTWEQSFPDVSGLVVPLRDAATGRVASVRLRRGEAEARREANEQRTKELLDTFRALDVDPVLVSSSDPATILAEFLVWSDMRRTRRVVGA